MKHSIKEGFSYTHVSRSAGMTLLELLVTISVAATVLTVAIPSYETLIQQTRFATFSNNYLLHLNLARSEAAKRNGRVVICKSADASTCTTAGNWKQGWIVFHDPNNNAQIDLGEEVLRVNEPLPSNWAFLGNTPVVSYVSYSSTGIARTTSGAFQAGTLTLCQVSQDGGEARTVVISATGRPRVQKTVVSECP